MSEIATQLERITQSCEVCKGVVTDEDAVYERLGDPVNLVRGTQTCPHCGHVETKDFPYQEGRFLAQGAMAKRRPPRRSRLPANTVVIHAGGLAYIPGPLLDRAGITTEAAVRILTPSKQLILRRPHPGESPVLRAIRGGPRARGARFALTGALRALGADPKTIRGPHSAVATDQTVRIFFPELLKGSGNATGH